MAVYLVVVFHGGSERFVGGFVGVDVFFVLSGFLVTQVLMRDLTASGTVSLRRFYSRRFRRLLPAAFATLVVTALVFSSIASPVEVIQAEDGFQAAFLYYANWHFIAQSTDYFGADVTSNPVLHFWSLAVEEQFYLVWPLLFGGVCVLGRRAGWHSWHPVRLVVGVAAVASLVWAWSLRSSNPSRAYYGSDARAYQLMAGALLALTPGLVHRLRRYSRSAQVASSVGLVLLAITASAWVHVDPIERGVLATALTVILIPSLALAPGGIGTRILSAEVVVYLGRISYATYLWHWPVIVVMARSFDLGSSTTIAFAVLIATALASLSYEVLERPIRSSTWLDRHRMPVIAAGLAVSVVSALVVIPAVARSAAHTTTAVAAPVRAAPGAEGTPGATPVPASFDFEAVSTDYPKILSCVDKSVADCTVVEGTGMRVLLMGDSHASMYSPALEAIAAQEDLTLVLSELGGCPWQHGLRRVARSPFGLPLPIEVCKAHQDDTYDRLLLAFDPDLVVVASVDYPARGLEYVGPDGDPLALDSPEADAWVQLLTRRSLGELRTGDRKVLLVEPTPLPPRGSDPGGPRFDPIACLSTATVVEECRYVSDPGPSSAERQYRRLDEDDDLTWSLDLDRLVCPYLPICDPFIDGVVVQIDGQHLSTAYARSLAPTISAYLKDNGIIPP